MLCITASTGLCRAVDSEPCFALGFGPRFAARLWPYLAVGSELCITASTGLCRAVGSEPRLVLGSGPRFAAGLRPYLVAGSVLCITASTESCRAVGSEPRLVLGSGLRFAASSEPRLVAGSEPHLAEDSEPCLAEDSEPRLAVGTESLWDLPCLGYQACCFSFRPIGVDLLLRPACLAKVCAYARLLEGEASVSVNTELVDVRASGVADVDA